MWLRDFNFFGNETVFPDLDPWYERIRDPAKARSSYPHLLFFAGDRHLAGRLVEVNQEKVIWQRPDTRELIQFPRQTVRRIVLADGPSDAESPFFSPPAPAPAAAAAAKAKNGDVPATLKLAGGDWLFGAIRSADGQTFTLQLDDGTSLTVPRRQVEWLYFAPLPGPGFGCSGSAMDMEGWIPSYVSPAAEAGTVRFRGASWVGRWLEPPKRFEVGLELPEDGEEGTRLWLEEYSARPNPTSFDDINVCFGKKEIARKALIKNRVDRERIPLPPEAQVEKGPVRYQLFYDGPGERLIVVRNGRPVADWSFVRERQGKRRPEREICGLCLDHTAWRDPVRLKLNRLSVRPWDGVIAGRAAADDHTDRFCTGDGVSIPGKLERISGKELVFSGQPQVRKEGAFVLFSPAADSVAGASAKVILDRNQGEFSVRDLQVHEGKVRCAAGFSPAVEFPVSAVKVMIFPEPPAAKSPGPEQLLIFKNGDELAGHAISAVSKGPLHWRTTHGQDLEIQPGRIAGVRLSRPPENPPRKESATMELRDGQSWRGKIMSYDGRQLKFEHEQIGPVVLESGLLWRLYPNPGFQALDGGCEPAAWMQEPEYPYRSSNNERDNNPDPWLAFAGNYIRRQAGRQRIFGDNDAAGLQRRIDPALERFEVRFDTISPEGGSTDLHATIAGGKGMPALWISSSHTELYVGVTAPAGALQPDSHKLSLAGKVPETTSRLSFRLFVDLRTGSSDVVINGRRVIHWGTWLKSGSRKQNTRCNCGRSPRAVRRMSFRVYGSGRGMATCLRPARRAPPPRGWPTATCSQAPPGNYATVNGFSKAIWGRWNFPRKRSSQWISEGARRCSP